MTKRIVLVFAKYPQPGAVKTRMVPPLTAEEAAAVHLASLLAVLDTARKLVNTGVVLQVTPDDQAGPLRALCGDRADDCWPQGDGDLGDRLKRATERAFDTGAQRLLLLGADSPTLTAGTLTAAFDLLDQRDAVLGPCDDGGYFLLGLRRPAPSLFERIAWGGPDVAAQTRRRAADTGVDLAELPAGYDLDRLEDLSRTLRDIDRMTVPLPPSTMALRELLESYTQRYTG